MTNEEMAIEYQQTGSNETLTDLYNQVKNFIAMQAHKRFLTAKDYDPTLTADDLIACGWESVLHAAETFRPDAGGKFLTWLNFHLKKAFAEELNHRLSLCESSLRTKYAIQTAASLNDAVTEKDDDLTLEGMIADPAAEEAFQTVEDKIYNEQLHKVLDQQINHLKPTAQNIIRSVYWDDKTLTEVSEEQHLSEQNASYFHTNGLKTMKRRAYTTQAGKKLLEYWLDLETPYYRNMSSTDGDVNRTTENIVMYRRCIAAKLRHKHL